MDSPILLVFGARSVFLHGQDLDGKIPCRQALRLAANNIAPWLREVDVVVCLLVRASRGVRSRRSSRPQHHRVLYFPHRHMWIMECSCKERADVWWASLLHTRFEDGAIEVAWDEFVRLFRAKFIPEHI
ncbi:hypothetical protein Taro_017584 [Colocasia esculenta]|uniref:Uncharacterized protein n=1 Tax=Colocasia esculenta TaxID=4460 RepID=A0A843UZU6_COLES|nr:hypothetical protein [Colocasia esculenta]